MTPPVQPQKPPAPFNPRELYLRLLDKGHSDAEARQIVVTHKKRAEFALNSGEQRDMEAVGFGTTILMGIGEGASQGLADEMAGVDAMRDSGKGVKKSSAYYAGRDQHRAMYARGIAQHRGAAIAGEIMGTVATLPILAAAMGMKGAALLPSSWEAAATAAKAGAVRGAVQGGLTGAGNADTVADIPHDAAVGAGIGALTGGVAAGVGGGLANRSGIATEVNAGKLARSRSAQLRAKADEARINHPRRPASQEAAHDAIQQKPVIASQKAKLLAQKTDAAEIDNAARFSALMDYLKNAPDDQLHTQLAVSASNPDLIPAMLARAMKAELARRTKTPQIAPGSTPFVQPHP